MTRGGCSASAPSVMPAALLAMLVLTGGALGAPTAVLAGIPSTAGASSAGGQVPDTTRDTALAEPIQPHPEAEDAISRLRSPYCPGLMLEVCPSSGGEALRDSLRMMAHEGVVADSLVAWTLARYGEEWRATPEAEGFGIWAWVMPPLVIVVGLLGVGAALRKLKRRGEDAAEPPDSDLTEEDEARVAAALKEMEEGEG